LDIHGWIRLGSPVGFIRFVATQKIKFLLSFRDGLLNATDHREPTRLLFAPSGFESPLIDIQGICPCKVVLSSDWLTIEFEHREPQLTHCQKLLGYVTMEIGPLLRGKAARFAKTLPAALMQVD